MMSFETYLAFVAATILLTLIPGPSIALFVAKCTTRGLREGLLAYAGSTTGLFILVIAAIFGMAPILSLASQWFDLVRIVGAFYLIWLGIGYLRMGLRHGKAKKAQSVCSAGEKSYKQGLLVALSNPKVLLFIGAFFPQFINPAGSMTQQLVVLGFTFLVIAGVVDGLIVLASGYAGKYLLEKQRETHIASGTLLIGAGVGLALARK